MTSPFEDNNVPDENNEKEIHNLEGNRSSSDFSDDEFLSQLFEEESDSDSSSLTIENSPSSSSDDDPDDILDEILSDTPDDELIKLLGSEDDNTDEGENKENQDDDSSKLLKRIRKKKESKRTETSNDRSPFDKEARQRPSETISENEDDLERAPSPFSTQKTPLSGKKSGGRSIIESDKHKGSRHSPFLQSKSDLSKNAPKDKGELSELDSLHKENRREPINSPFLQEDDTSSPGELSVKNADQESTIEKSATPGKQGYKPSVNENYIDGGAGAFPLFKPLRKFTSPQKSDEERLALKNDSASDSSSNNREDRKSTTPATGSTKKKSLILIIGLVLITALVGSIMIIAALFSSNTAQIYSGIGICGPGTESGKVLGGGERGVPEGEFAKPELEPPAVFTSPFGPRWGAEHNGIDYAYPHATARDDRKIYAYADGKVSFSETSDPSGFGQYIIIEHNEDGKRFDTLYGHMQERLVQTGDMVKAGQPIAIEGAEGGSTGSHLHFEVHENGYKNPVDPMPYWDKAVNVDGSGSSDGEDTKNVSNEKSASSTGAQILDKDKLQPATVKLGELIASEFPEIQTIGGYRDPALDSYGFDHSSGRALDVMIPDYSSDRGKSLGTEINKFLMDNKELPIDYTIWRQQLFYQDGEVQSMSDRGSDTENHMDHVHITLIDNADTNWGDISGRDGSGVSFTDSSAGYACCAIATSSDSNTFTDSGNSVSLEDAVSENAKIIIDAGKKLKMSDDDIITALMVGLGESGLRNLANDGTNANSGGSSIDPEELKTSLDYAHDGVGSNGASLGVFQQQAGIWGMVDDLMDPSYQAGQFFGRLKNIDKGDKSKAQIATEIQGNSGGASSFESFEGEAKEILSSLDSSSDGSSDASVVKRGFGNQTTYEESDGDDSEKSNSRSVSKAGSSSNMGCGVSNSSVGGVSSTLNPDGIPPEYVPLLEKAAQTCDMVTAPFLAAIIQQESGWNPNAVSWTGAKGIAQFMPGTWAAIAPGKDPFNPEHAIEASAKYHCQNAEVIAEAKASGKIQGDDFQLLAAAYNAGVGAVLDAGGVPNGGDPNNPNSYAAQTYPYATKIIPENMKKFSK